MPEPPIGRTLSRTQRRRDTQQQPQRASAAARVHLADPRECDVAFGRPPAAAAAVA